MVTKGWWVEKVDRFLRAGIAQQRVVLEELVCYFAFRFVRITSYSAALTERFSA